MRLVFGKLLCEIFLQVEKQNERILDREGMHGRSDRKTRSLSVSALNISVILFVLMALFNYRVSRSVLYPPFVFCAMFLSALFIFQAGWIEINPLHITTLAILAAGAAAFTLGGLFASLIPKKLLKVHLFPSAPRSGLKPLRKFLTLFLVCGIPFLFYDVLQLSKFGSGSNLLMSARQAQLDAINNGAQVHSFMLDYFLTIATFTVFAYAVEKWDCQFYIALAITFTACILSTGRVSLLVLISGVSTIRLLKARKENFFSALKIVRWPIAIFLFMYVLLIFTNKNANDIVGGGEGIANIAMFLFLSYIAGPLAAFDVVVQHPSDFIPLHTQIFDYFAKLAAAVHLMPSFDTPRFDEFILVPFPANVYTIFKYYFLELGLVGTLSIFLLIGFIHALAYFKAREGGFFSMFFFATSIFAAFMAVFNDNYSLLSGYIKAVLFGFLYFTVRGANLHLRLHPSMRIRFRWVSRRTVMRQIYFRLLPSKIA